MSDKVKEILNASRQFEGAMLDRQKTLTKAGWSIAVLFAVLSILLAVAIIVLLPLKERIVELYVLDKITGRTEYITRVKDRDISTETAMAKSFAASYVTRREGYNYFALQNDYNVSKLYSSDTVKNEYIAWFNSPNAPDEVFKKAAMVANVEIISNVHADATKPDHLAQLRIKKTIHDVATGKDDVEYWHIRLTYHYTPFKELTESQREVNPLGFTVTSYQRDKELRKE
ncbi:type IV secretion system protein [Salmonella enterica subsp. enterica serovar Wilhelmsburg]|nr:type IV secretion system protein [Salmonella enterica subsp. enterica serovar Wilhelmsburg]